MDSIGGSAQSMVCPSNTQIGQKARNPVEKGRNKGAKSGGPLKLPNV